MLFWFDAGDIMHEQLASDMRFMNTGAFSKAGLVIAWPQQDIHLDSRIPLPVEIAGPGPNAAARVPAANHSRRNN